MNSVAGAESQTVVNRDSLLPPLSDRKMQKSQGSFKSLHDERYKHKLSKHTETSLNRL